MKFSANISTLFSDLASLSDRYRHLLSSKCGQYFDTIECQDPYQLSPDEYTNLFQECQNKGYNLPKWDLINSPHLFQIYSQGQIPSQDEFQSKILNKVVDYCQLLNCPKVHLVMNDLPSSSTVDREKSMVEMINLLYFGASFLSKHQINVVIEPLSIRDNYYLRSYDQAIDIVKRYTETTGQGNMKVLLDIFHLQKLHGNITEYVRRTMPSVGHIQISQAPDRDGPFNLGEINYDYVLKLLASANYQGYVGLEYKNTTNDSFDWMRDYITI